MKKASSKEVQKTPQIIFGTGETDDNIIKVFPVQVDPINDSISR